MSEPLFNFDYPLNKSSNIKVVGVGGGGGNAVNYMFEQGIVDVDFIVCNTDEQVLKESPVPITIQLGPQLTNGRGAGNDPEIGKQAAIESIDRVTEVLFHNAEMVFITAGLGGGTGTGAAPVIAKECKDQDILTVAIVTLPFKFEGELRRNQAQKGLEVLRLNVDALLIINNEKLFELYSSEPMTKAFNLADNILNKAAKGIAEIVTICGKINVDFADVKTVMRDSGLALMGSGIAEGEDREIKAIEEALQSPLLDIENLNGAKNILLNIASSKDQELTMKEFNNITRTITNAVGSGANIIWGNTFDESLENKISLVIVCTGFEEKSDDIIRFYIDEDDVI